eukprot:gnl/Dysnectes_brevis/509_a565_2075.p1 GENE.gnl/Dysnectes_brevis/509_a565_2075~~gnl/Dysnectes_brevis/509_a565_2075.p1  ORF type:complete len:280 (-),score=0.58 gnl/Dysnectes_brevis/509_a565_2075:27-797(-)
MGKMTTSRIPKNTTPFIVPASKPHQSKNTVYILAFLILLSMFLVVSVLDISDGRSNEPQIVYPPGIVFQFNISADCLELTIPTVQSLSYSATISWDDGTTSIVGSSNSVGLSHTYAAPGSYFVSIYGDFPGFSFEYSPHRSKLTQVLRLGDTGLTTLAAAFKGCDQLTSLDGVANLAGVTNTSEAFLDCSSLTSLDVSQSEIEREVRLEQDMNIDPMSVTLDVSQSETEREVILEQDSNIESISVTLDVSQPEIER